MALARSLEAAEGIEPPYADLEDEPYSMFMLVSYRNAAIVLQYTAFRSFAKIRSKLRESN